MGIHMIIVVVFMASMLIMGLYFSRRQKSTDQYFVAKRSLPGWAVGLSLMATLISSMTFIAYPGAAFEGDWSLLTPGFMVPVVLILAVWVLIPMYRKIIRVSAYEYFELRFGKIVRLYGSFAFSLNHFAKMGFVFYLVALTVTSITGWNVLIVIWMMGIVTILFTYLGGLEAVIWTDVVQGFILLVGVIISLGFVLYIPEGGPAKMLSLAWENHKFNLGSTDFGFSTPTLMVLLIYGFAWNFQKFAADQTVVQRYLAVKSEREARKGLILGALLCIPVWTLFMLLGTSLWSFYQISGETLPSTIVKAEQVFPHFLVTQIPPLLSGLVVAAMMAAAMSTISSDLNCLSAVGVEDFYRPLKPGSTDKQRLRVGRMIVAVSGLLCIFIAIYLVNSEGTALSLWFMISSIVSAGLAGLFFLAFMTTRANKQGVYVGIIAAIGFTAWATYTIGANKTFDLGFLKTPIHSYMVGVIAHIVLIITGYVASFFFKSNSQDVKRLTLWGYLEKK